MNKLLISSVLFGALLTSCGLNELPEGVLSEETALTNFDNITKYRNGFYNNLRSMTAGAYIGYPELQADNFIGLQNNGNFYGAISLGNIGSETTDLTGAWSSPYASIAAVNYFLMHLDNMMQSEGLSESEMVTLVRYRGEAKWTRAYAYYYLVDHYCQAYNLASPDAPATGVPVITEYDPTGDYAKYPGRNTLSESYAQIEKDLEDSYNDLAEYEATLGLGEKLQFRSANANYLNTCIVQAFQARIALLKADYATAKEKAEAVIANTNYKLCTRTNYSQMWTNDTGSELLFVLYGDQNQAAGVPATGTMWQGSDASTEKAWYIPTANCLALYDADNDVRYDTYFEERSLNVEGSYYYAPAFIKFPGNPSLNLTNTNAYKNLPKPFRLSETYLILAEAAAASNDEAKANSALNTLRKNRISGYTDQTYAGTTLVNEIRLERNRELIGEGFRISDLRRWNLGFSRSIDYPEQYKDAAEIIVPSGATVTYPAGYYMYIWPIPNDEMEANPQIADQQNPGY